jgi:hypothetical protein
MEPRGLLFATLIIGLLVAAMTIDQAIADTIDDPPVRRERPNGPPPEAYAACEGKNAGEAVLVETPHGDTIEAVCTLKDDRLFARPINPPPPPPERSEQKSEQ